MALNNFGPLTNLQPGQSAAWTVSFGGDPGSQLFTADIKTPNQGATHRYDNNKKRKLNDGSTRYLVTITNEGPGSCFHNLQGGGLT
jgi:hypothetical protein